MMQKLPVPAPLPQQQLQQPQPQPAAPQQTTKNENTLHHCRRRQRQRENIWSLLSSLPSPFGSTAPAQYRSLSSWATSPRQLDCPVDWPRVPPSCEPSAFLNSPSTTSIRNSKSVKSVMQQLGLDDAKGADPDPPVAPDAALPSEPAQGGLLPSEPAQGRTRSRRASSRLPRAAVDAAHLDRRGRHKQWQVESFVMVLQRLIDSDPGRPWHIVDFGCGTGALLLPLAFLFPSCRFTGVEVNPAAVAILRQRAAAAELTNVHTYLGMIENFEDPFHIALGLHACGNATDMAMLRAMQHRGAYIMSPCCVGKLKFSLQGGSAFGADITSWDFNPRMRNSSSSERQEARDSLLAAAGQQQQQPPPPGTGQQPHGKGGAADEQAACLDSPEAGASSAGGAEAEPGAGSASGVGGLRALRHPRSQVFSRLLPNPQEQYKLMAQVADTVYAENKQDQEQAPAPATAINGALTTAALQDLSTLLEDAPKGTSEVQSREQGSGPGQPSEQDAERGGGGGLSRGQAAEGGGSQGAAAAAPSGQGSGSDVARRAALCALAKLHVELDRNESAREEDYAVGVFRMKNAGAMSKGDLLVGLPAEQALWQPLLHLLQRPGAGS